MDDFQRADLAASGISAIIANRAYVRLCNILQITGALTPHAVEVLRHYHLRDFDEMLAEIDDEATREAVDNVRERLDALWQTPAQEAPSADGSMP